MKKLLAMVLALCMVLSMTACGSSNSTNASPQSTESVKEALENQQSQQGLEDVNNVNNSVVRDQITIGWVATTSLTPWGTKNNTPGNYEVYEMLYECDAKGNIFPLLADASYEGSFMPGCDHEPDSGVYTVKIYDYIKDHKGNAITASDVAYSYMYQYENEETSGWGKLISVEAPDDTTVVFNFESELKNLGELENIFCRCFIVDEDAHKNSDSQLNAEMIGTGPYKFVSYVSGSTLTLEKNEDYWQKPELCRQEQQANVKTIVYQFITESAQNVIALKTGAVDFVHDLDSNSSLDFADGGEFADQYNVYTYSAKFVYYLTPNCSKDSICNDLNMRLAILNAVDQDGLITALGGTNVRAYAYVSDYYSDYDMVDWAGMDNYNTRTSVDSAKVQEYLKAANYNGEKLVLVCNNQNDMATVIAAQMAAQGINVEVQSLDTSSYRAAVSASSGWDLDLGRMAGDYNVTVWSHGFSFANTGDGDHASNWTYDKAWDDQLNLCCTAEGHTAENMQKWWQMAVDNAYTMGLFTMNTYDIIPEDMTYVALGDKLTPLPGACSFAAQN